MFRLILRSSAALCLLVAGILLFSAHRAYVASEPTLPPGSTLAGLPAGGLTRSAASERLNAVYLAPVELWIEESRVQMQPAQLGFRLLTDAMLDTAFGQAQRSFWDALWNRLPPAVSVELLSEGNETVLQSYLQTEILSRYSQPVTPAGYLPATGQFTRGMPGSQLDRQSMAAGLRSALLSPTDRVVKVRLQTVDAPAPSLVALELVMRQVIQGSGFDGLAEVYLRRQSDGAEINFASLRGSPVSPGVAFTAASTMKVPILVSVLKRASEPTPDDLLRLFNRMIVYSENPPTDTLMEWIDPVRGPLDVTRDMQALGFENTFIAGFFYLGAPLLQQFDTPANQRVDIDLDPDIYNQTTPAEIGRLLGGIGDCAAGNPGVLRAAFGDELSTSECNLMLDLLRQNKNGLLIEAGLPDGTLLAHKHGWIEESDQLLHTMSDVGLVSSPGGDYVLVVYLYDFEQLQFNPANQFVAELSNVVYNFFNPDQPAAWPFGPTRYP